MEDRKDLIKKVAEQKAPKKEFHVAAVLEEDGHNSPEWHLFDSPEQAAPWLAERGLVFNDSAGYEGEGNNFNRYEMWPDVEMVDDLGRLIYIVDHRTGKEE